MEEHSGKREQQGKRSGGGKEPFKELRGKCSWSFRNEGIVQFSGEEGI